MKPSINDFICLHHTDKERELIGSECPVCAIQFQIQELIMALPDPEKLRILARHFDLLDMITGSINREVQNDLERWANSAETLINKYKQPDEAAH